MSLALLLGLGVVLVVFAVGMAWQERRAGTADAVVYGVEESIDYIWDRLDSEIAESVSRGDVRRILEWELHFLQKPKVRGKAHPVVGGIEAAQYAQDRASAAGYAFEPAVIFAVLDLQAEYLGSIGAVAEPADQPASEEKP